MFTFESVFKNLDMLNQAWIPEIDKEPRCRESELKYLWSIHQHIIKSDSPFSNNTLVVGKGGIGKTLTIRWFFQYFKTEMMKKEKNIHVEYDDCLQFRTKSALLRNLYFKLGNEKEEIHSGYGYSDSELMIKIIETLQKRQMYCILILDEATHIPSDDILAILNASIAYGQNNTRLSIILIARQYEWIRYETEKIRSRIQNIIKMEPYNKADALKILMFRRNLAFRSGILEDSELNIIADIVEETKSMRTGIDIMQYSGLYCDRFHYTRITYNIIEFAKMDINPNLRPEFIDNLKDHAIIILFAIARLSKIRKTFISSLNQIFEFYQSVCSELNITSVKITAFKRHMKELSEQRIISMKLHNSSKGNRGRKEMVTLNERKDILEICENKIKNAN